MVSLELGLNKSNAFLEHLDNVLMKVSRFPLILSPMRYNFLELHRLPKDFGISSSSWLWLRSISSRKSILPKASGIKRFKWLLEALI